MSVPGIDMGALRARLAGPLYCEPDELTAMVIDSGRRHARHLLKR